MNIYEKRWAAAQKWYNDFITKANLNGCEMFVYDGDFYDICTLKMTDSMIFIHEANCICAIFVNDLSEDAGLYTTVESFKHDVLDSFKLVKIID